MVLKLYGLRGDISQLYKVDETLSKENYKANDYTAHEDYHTIGFMGVDCVLRALGPL